MQDTIKRHRLLMGYMVTHMVNIAFAKKDDAVMRETVYVALRGLQAFDELIDPDGPPLTKEEWGEWIEPVRLNLGEDTP